MVRIDIQCLYTIEEEILEGLRPIQVLLIMFPIMNQGQGGHAAYEVFRCVIHTLGGQNDRMTSDEESVHSSWVGIQWTSEHPLHMSVMNAAANSG